MDVSSHLLWPQSAVAFQMLNYFTKPMQRGKRAWSLLQLHGTAMSDFNFSLQPRPACGESGWLQENAHREKETETAQCLGVGLYEQTRALRREGQQVPEGASGRLLSQNALLPLPQQELMFTTQPSHWTERASWMKLSSCTACRPPLFL